MVCEILCVGTELLLGDIVNTDGAYVARELAALGLTSYHQTVVGDNPDRLREALMTALSRADLVITTDIIVGFPGETDEEFEDTIKLCEKVRYDAMFTFIYSKRVGTPAAEMPDAATREDKQVRFDRLLDCANRISGEKHAEYEGKTLRVLVDGETGKPEYNLSSRTNGGRLVHLRGDTSLNGKFTDVKITSSNTWALYGEVV